jgi:hypothetical protein
MSDKARAELAPTGVLRAGINLSNFLLVTGRTATGDPVGVAPDMAREIAASLGVPINYVPFKTPGGLEGTNQLYRWIGPTIAISIQHFSGQISEGAATLTTNRELQESARLRAEQLKDAAKGL